MGAVLYGGTAGADFYVIPVPASVGTRIVSLPYTITNPGFYFLSRNLTVASGNAITISADDVTLDLMGFSLIGPGSQGNGVLMHGRANVEVRNGTIRGFASGIMEDSSSGANHRIIAVTARTNANYGIYLKGQDHLVQKCHALDSETGIYVENGIIKENSVSSNNTGIYANASSIVRDNYAHSNVQFGINSGTYNLIDQNVSTLNFNGGNYGECLTCVWGLNSGH
jgi:hypothetical protein